MHSIQWHLHTMSMHEIHGPGPLRPQQAHADV